jgi:hypothetical protein
VKWFLGIYTSRFNRRHKLFGQGLWELLEQMSERLGLNHEGAEVRASEEQHEVGWPLPAAVVAWMEWMRNWLAMPSRVSTAVDFIFAI